MAEVTQPRVKEYQDYAKSQIDEQAILDKYNAATIAQFNVQREQNRQAENQFYNQMYNTQKTAMDTIRQANAAAVSSGASRGVQAANELSALLGLEQESVASATELAQANRQTAQEETAAVLENVLNAYQQAAQERSQLVTQGIEAASLEAQEGQNVQTEIQTYAQMYTQALANGDAAGAQAAWNMLQQLNGKMLNNTSNTSEAPTSTLEPTFKSGIQSDGSLKFNTGDLNNKEYNNIKNALKEAGYTSVDFTNDLFDIYNTDEYDKIKQWDFDKDHQTGEAGNYINAIIADAKADKIPVGSILNLNYGESLGDKNYVYLGNGKFMPFSTQKTAQYAYGRLDNDILSKVYVPQGYKSIPQIAPTTLGTGHKITSSPYYTRIKVTKA